MSSRLKTQLAELPTSLPIPADVAPSLWRPVLVAGALLVGQALVAPPAPRASDPQLALAQTLATRGGLSASPSDVFWVDPPVRWWNPWGTRRAWVLAARPGELDDVYLSRVRATPEGQVLSAEAIYNLTDTRAAAERVLTASGTQAAWFTGTEYELLRLTWADLASDALAGADAADFTRGQRLQWRLTWLQETGQWRGLARQQFKLIPPAKAALVEFEPGGPALRTEHGSVSISQTAEGSGAQHLARQVYNLAKPGSWLTWSVDRLRAMPWFGDQNMQRLKAVVYRVWDAASRRFGLGIGGNASDLRPVGAAQSQRQTETPASLLPESLQRPWPPSPITPLISPAEAAEGEWLSLNDDPFIKPSGDASGLFFSTFIRTDPERAYSRIIITVWDPLMVQLHTMSGTEEPKSATGETGPGLVPREPRVIRNLVGAFNGGFQTTHGDFGMMAEGVVYVPPLPFAATVANDRDGRVGFGTWPQTAQAPEDLVGLRQNLTPLVASGVFNPYQRTWWGGVPSGWEDDTRTVRSGICLTDSGLVAYFYGAKVDAENLAKAMLAARCSYGLHLDMNQGHTGLEFYHVAPQAELPPLALTLDHVWQAEGPVPEAPGLAFRGRRMFRAMQLMNFPRYIQRETRDFFYLTLREYLPNKTNNDGWSIPPVAQKAFPPAVAVRSATPRNAPGTLLQLVELSPELLTPRTHSDGLIVASLRKAGAEGRESVYWAEGKWGVGSVPREAAAMPIFSVVPAGDRATAMVCIRHDTRNLLYAEVASSSDPSRQRALLEQALVEEGCPAQSCLQVDSGAFEIGGRDLNGHPSDAVHPRLHLAYRRPTRHFALFPDTPVVPPATWKPLQSKPH